VPDVSLWMVINVTTADAIHSGYNEETALFAPPFPLLPIVSWEQLISAKRAMLRISAKGVWLA